MSKNLISNLILLFFIPISDIEDFYQSIKNNYNSKSYFEFFGCVDKFIYQKINGKLYIWNFSKFIQNKDINENKYFVTNNFVERTNKTLNENLIYKKSSFINFRNSILYKDIYFENKSGYKLNNPNLSKSIVYYLNNSNYYDKNKKVKLILSNTKKYI